MDLRLTADAPWQRASPEQEREDDALGLSWPVEGGVSLQLLVLRSPSRIKSDAETFYRNLTQKWRGLYGKALAVGWLPNDVDAAESPQGPRWLVGRRPSQSGKGVVFHLASVHGGQAYSVLVFAPAGTQTPPLPARAVVAKAGFQEPVLLWRQSRTLALVPRGEALAALAQAETEALGEKGMLTGYSFRELAVEGSGVGLAWGLEGFRWAQRAGRDAQVPFDVRGRLNASAPTAWDGEVRIGLEVSAAESPMEARVSVHSYCGPPEAWRAALAALDKGARTPLQRLGREQPCGDVPFQPAQAAWLGRVGERQEHAFSLSEPGQQGKAGPRWVEIALVPEAGALGEGLLGRLALVLVYEPE